MANGRRREKEAHDNGRESCREEMNSHLSLEGPHRVVRLMVSTVDKSADVVLLREKNTVP